MSERSTRLLLNDIEQAIGRILQYTTSLTIEQYKTDRKTKDAVERNFKIIGEAASRLPGDYRKQNSEVEWRVIKDFRNVIIHESFVVNDQMIWNVIEQYLPDLRSKIQKMLKSLEEHKDD